MNERLSFSAIREMALKANIPDNKIAIGLWAKENYYMRRHTLDKNRKSVYYYIKIVGKSADNEDDARIVPIPKIEN